MNIYSYYFRKGPVESHVPFDPPTREIFSKWLDDFLKIKYVSRYDVWLSGGFLQKKWFTRDVDISLTGPVDPIILEKIMIEAYESAFEKYHLLIDLQHISNPLIHPYKPITYTCLVLEGEPENRPAHHKNVKKIGTHLIQIDKSFPSEKQLKHIEKFGRYDIPPLLLSKRSLNSV